MTLAGRREAVSTSADPERASARHPVLWPSGQAVQRAVMADLDATTCTERRLKRLAHTIGPASGDDL